MTLPAGACVGAVCVAGARRGEGFGCVPGGVGATVDPVEDGRDHPGPVRVDG